MPDRFASSQRLARIAQSGLKLAALGPRLAALAEEMNVQATQQAGSAAAVAEVTTQLARELEGAVVDLRGSSGQVEQALGTVTRIADQTRILSINASIEAARSGEQGRAFAVVASEVQRLADHTNETTRLIEDRVHDMRSSLGRVAAMSGHSETTAAAEGTQSVEAVNKQVQDMARSAGQQLKSAQTLNAFGRDVHTLTESLVLALGAFRFEAHTRAERDVSTLLPTLDPDAAGRVDNERALAQWLEAHPHFELAYLTDARGRQIVDNIGWREGGVAHDPAGYGRDWSQRPWYREAIAREGLGSTDLYRSTATGDFCFTVTAALRGPADEIRGVLGVDVNFQRLVHQ